MFTQHGGSWDQLAKNLIKHKRMILTLGDTNQEERLHRNLVTRSEFKKQFPNVADMLKVIRHKSSDGPHGCAYLLTLGDFSNNAGAKLLLEKEW